MSGDDLLPYSERAVTFRCDGESLVGVIAAPQRPAPVAVVIVVGGPQYRAGSHRQFVELARALAAAGHAVLRFDCRGMGDSSGDWRGFEAIGPDIGAAVDALLREQPTVHRVVLWGLCDAASAALMYFGSTRDARVAGLCLANPWLRSEVGQARTQVRHYYVRRLRERGFWLKLLSGRVAGSAIAGLWRNLRATLASPAPAPDQEQEQAYARRMIDGWRAFSGPLLLLCSGMDYTAKEFIDTTQRDAEWRSTLQRSSLRRLDLPQADHTFSGEGQSQQVSELTLDWLRQLEP